VLPFNVIETPKALKGKGLGESIPLPSRLGRSVVSSHISVWGGAPAEIEFGGFWSPKLTSGEEKLSDIEILAEFYSDYRYVVN